MENEYEVESHSLEDEGIVPVATMSLPTFDISDLMSAKAPSSEASSLDISDDNKVELGSISDVNPILSDEEEMAEEEANLSELSAHVDAANEEIENTNSSMSKEPVAFLAEKPRVQQKQKEFSRDTGGLILDGVVENLTDQDDVSSEIEQNNQDKVDENTDGADLSEQETVEVIPEQVEGSSKVDEVKVDKPSLRNQIIDNVASTVVEPEKFKESVYENPKTLEK